MGFYTQKIIDNTKTEIISPLSVYDSMILTNVDASNDVVVDLYVTEQNGTKLRQAAEYENTTPTKVNLVAGYPITSNSQTIIVDTTSPSNDIFLNEKVFKSDGTFIGTCTESGGASPITFAGGLETTLANNDDLYTGARFYMLKNTTIPNGTALKLTADEIFFDNIAYTLYIVSGDANGQIDIMLRYNTKSR